MFVMDGILWFAFCKSNPVMCEESNQFVWTIVNNPEITNFTYVRDPSSLIDGLPFNNGKTPEEKGYIKANFQDISVSTEVLFEQNSFLDIASHKDQNKTIITYFSGGGDIQQDDCIDMTLYYMNITGISEGNPSVKSLTSIAMKEYLQPRNDYASVVLIISGTPFFIIHGGMNCECQDTFSDLFAINLIENQYISIFQNATLSW